MESAFQGEGHPFVAPTVEGAPSALAMDKKEDHGTTPASSTRAAMKKVCLVCQIICIFDLWPNCAFLERQYERARLLRNSHLNRI